ncbi:expressed unknown protein [Seminavis robusta]|uniref:RPA-interacting protein C-terminal domain-containing protein n=1 Tax=Seminavis robusta TaxID=568900 RepID=A0A9N8DT60_9STRA|nr:expressed unknown protein [Seminavis robusta]|eukprot:Sro263_g102220.1 n/a (305) ;mRNA; f:24273-25187
MNSTTSFSGTSIRRRLTTTAKQRSQLHNQWKESLRQACVSRARKNRKDLIWRKRQQQQPTLTNDDDMMARSLVEQELRQQGVSIVTPRKASTVSSVDALNYGLTTENRTNPAAQPCSMMADEEEHGFSISEQELDELLQEVEEELRRNEEELLEEMLEEERCQQEDMALQIAEYEEWQNTSNNTSMDEEEFVICPLCCESMLVQQQQQQQYSSQSHQPTNMTIACPNDTCHFQITSTMGLADLKEQLRVAFEEHSMTCPHSGTLTFDLLPPMEATEQQQLVGSCPECDGVILPVGQMPSASLTF